MRRGNGQLSCASTRRGPANIKNLGIAIQNVVEVRRGDTRRDLGPLKKSHGRTLAGERGYKQQVPSVWSRTWHLVELLWLSCGRLSL